MISPLLRGGAVAALLLVSPLLACADDRVHAPTVAMDLTRPRAVPAPTIPLALVPLETQVDFDRFESGAGAGLTADETVAIYDAMLAGSPSKGVETLLRLRVALQRLSEASGRAGLTRAFGAVERLKQAAPEAPHTLYMLARIKEMLLTAGSKDHTFHLTPQNRDVAQQLLADWERLGAVAPDYKGPHGFDATRLGDQVSALRASLAVPAVQDGVLEGRRPAEALDTSALEARRLLWDFMTADRVGRLTLCRDRPAPSEKARGDDLVGLLDLSCGWHMGDADAALKALRALVKAGASVDPCHELARLQDRVPTLAAAHPERVALLEDMTRAGLPACAPGAP